MRKYLLFTLLLVALNSFAQFEAQWAQSLTGDGLERIWEIKSDKQDNVFVCGQFTENMTIGDEQLSCVGITDSFIAKFDKTGELLWVYHPKGEGSKPIVTLDTDDEGSVVFSGYFEGSIDFDGLTYESENWQFMIIKLDADGNPQWLYNPRCGAADIAHGVTVHNDGTVYFTGWYQQDIIMSNEITLPCYGSSDILLGSLTKDGELRWATHMGNESVNYGYSIDTDPQGDVYFCGVCDVNSDFSGNMTEGGGAFMAKYTKDGEFVYVSTANAIGPYGMGVDAASCAVLPTYLHGEFSATIGDHVLEASETEDIVLARLNQEGEWSDVIRLHGTGTDKMRKVSFDDEGNTYFVGTFTDTLYINDDELVVKNKDLILLRLNADWEIDWYQQIGGELSENSFAINIDSEGAINLGFWTEGTFQIGDFTIGSGDAGTTGSAIVRFINVVGFEDNEAPELHAELYPNPVSDYLKVESTRDETITCSIYSIDGKLVHTCSFNSSSKLDLTKLKSGSYVIQLSSESSKTESIKIIKE